MVGWYDARSAALDNNDFGDYSMHDEAEITINGTRLTDAESMTVRVAVDTLANVLAEDIGTDSEAQALADRYMAALSTIQSLLENRQSRKQ